MTTVFLPPSFAYRGSVTALGKICAAGCQLQPLLAPPSWGLVSRIPLLTKLESCSGGMTHHSRLSAQTVSTAQYSMRRCWGYRCRSQRRGLSADNLRRDLSADCDSMYGALGHTLCGMRCNP